MESRPTLGQYSASANGMDPWQCRRCGCMDWRVADSRFDGKQRNRQRVCRNCSEPMSTGEVPVPDGFEIRVVPIDESA